MSAFPTYTRLYFNITGAWWDASSYVISSFDFEWGMSSRPLDMVANTGELVFTLNNQSRLFSPDYSGCLTGFKKGIGVKLVVGYNGEEYVRFKGVLSEFDDDNSGASWEGNQLRVTALDWMDYASEHKIVNPGVLSDKRGDEVITQVLSDMPIQPSATDVDEGVETFSTVFDTVTSTTTAYSEFQKVAASEIGYVYLRKDADNGETLVFENRDARNGLRDLSTFAGELSFLLKADGAILLQANGNPLLLNSRQQAYFQDNTSQLEIEYGKELVNYLTEWAYPRKLDSSAQILFRLNEPIPIAPGQSVELKGTYVDPDGGNPVNGQNMVTPVANTDYKVWSNSDGTGTDLTAGLFHTSVNLGSEGFTNRVVSSGTSVGYITQYNVRGIGIYTYNPIQHLSTHANSVDEFGMRSETLHQRYQRTTDAGRVFGDALVDRQRTPRTVIKSATFIANTDGSLMQAFLNLDVGDLIRLKNTWNEIDSLFYIQGIKAKIEIGGYVVFKLILRQAFSLLLGLSAIAIEFDGGSTKDAVNFGYLPRVYSDATPETISFSAWLRTDDGGSIVGFITNGGGVRFNLARPGGTPKLFVYSNVFKTNPGEWWTDALTLNVGTLYHVAMTYDISSPSNDPIIYLNGVAYPLTEIQTPSGDKFTKTGVPLIIGNRKTATEDYNFAFDGKLYDVRVYHKILTQADVTALYNGGTSDTTVLTDDLVFQAFAVRTKELSEYTNAPLSSDMKLIDNIFGAVGTPNSEPTGRLTP